MTHPSESACVCVKSAEDYFTANFGLEFHGDFHVFRVLEEHVAPLILKEYDFVSFLDFQNLR